MRDDFLDATVAEQPHADYQPNHRLRREFSPAYRGGSGFGKHLLHIPGVYLGAELFETRGYIGL
jgi:hypothetical protein